MNAVPLDESPTEAVLLNSTRAMTQLRFHQALACPFWSREWIPINCFSLPAVIPSLLSPLVGQESTTGVRFPACREPYSRANGTTQCTMDFEAGGRNFVAFEAAVLLTCISQVSPFPL